MIVTDPLSGLLTLTLKWKNTHLTLSRAQSKKHDKYNDWKQTTLTRVKVMQENK